MMPTQTDTPSFQLARIAAEMADAPGCLGHRRQQDLAAHLRRISIEARSIETEAARRSRFMRTLRWAVGLE